MADAPESLIKARHTGVNLLLADLDMALTFMDVAAVSGCEETSKRNHQLAREAYQTVLRLLEAVRPDAAQRAAFSGKLALLEARLEKVGYRFEPKTG